MLCAIFGIWCSIAAVPPQPSCFKDNEAWTEAAIHSDIEMGLIGKDQHNDRKIENRGKSNLWVYIGEIGAHFDEKQSFILVPGSCLFNVPTETEPVWIKGSAGGVVRFSADQ